MKDNWEAKIVECPGIMLKELYLFRDGPEGREFITHSGSIAIKKHGDYIVSEELHFARMSDNQLQAFANGLALEGIKTTNDSKNEGILQATERHLEDMRSLVFKTNKKD